MKKIVMAGLLMSVVQTVVHAEPVFMPQAAPVVKAHQAELGVDGNFGYQTSEIEGSPGTTFKNRVWQIPLIARYGLLDTLESHLLIPIVRAIDSSEGTASSRSANTGLGNIQLGAKWLFLPGRFPLAAAVDFDLPTANSRNHPAALGWRYNNQVQQGFNTHLQLLADTPAMAERYSAHAMIGYLYTGRYTTAQDSKFNPSDLMTFGASLDAMLLKGEHPLSASIEMVGNTGLNHSKTDDVRNGNDKGTVLEVGPALRHQCGPLRTHVGLLFDAGRATFRAYNYRVNFGVSLFVGGK